MKTKIDYLIGIVIVLNILHLSSCVTPQKQKLPEFLPVAEGDIPGDAKLVAAAVLTRFTGYKISKILGVSFKEGAEIDLDNPDYNYAGFIIKGHRLYRYAGRPGGKPGRLVAGLLDLEDLFGRRAELNYIAQYDLTEKGLIIEEAKAVSVFSTDPRVELYIVPAETLEKEKDNFPPIWEGLYSMAKSSDRLRADKENPNRKSKENILLLFLMNRTAPSAQATLRLAKEKNPDLDYGYAKASQYLNYNGFQVAMVSGEFPGKPEKPFFLKMVFSPGKEAQSSSKRIIFHEDLRMLAGQ